MQLNSGQLLEIRNVKSWPFIEKVRNVKMGQYIQTHKYTHLYRQEIIIVGTLKYKGDKRTSKMIKDNTKDDKMTTKMIRGHQR